MKAIKLTVLALCAWAAGEVSACAAWNNVFQPTCFFGRRQSTSNYCPSCVPVAPVPVIAASPPPCATCAPAPVVACAPPPPVQQCTTNFVQRSFYEPVTVMESRSFYEPVTTMQTSFYWEPVTTMQTSFYPDPCSCGVVARSSPVTSFQLRQKQCPVQTWVQRCAQVPVQSFRLSYKLEPVTTCAAVPACPQACPTCPPSCPPCPTCPTCPQQAPANPNPTPSYSPPPVIDTPKSAPAGPNVGTTSYGYYPSTVSNTQKPASAWQPANVNLGPIQPENDAVRGQVVCNDRSPNGNAQVLFVNATTGARHAATTNAAGQFNLPLASGDYHVYLANQSGGSAYHSRVNVKDRQPNVVNLVN